MFCKQNLKNNLSTPRVILSKLTIDFSIERKQSNKMGESSHLIISHNLHNIPLSDHEIAFNHFKLYSHDSAASVSSTEYARRKRIVPYIYVDSIHTIQQQAFRIRTDPTQPKK